MSAQVRETLVPSELYRKAGVIYGTQICTRYMRQFVHRILPEGYYQLDYLKTDERLAMAAKFLSMFDPEKIAVVSVRIYGQKPVRMMCERVGCKAITGRIIPGTFTNPNLEHYVEPDVVVVTDPRMDRQAVLEASKVGIPVVALVDTDNSIENIDFVIPANNRGRRSLALIYWILTREILRRKGVLKPDEDLDVSYEEFMARKVFK
ncbi:30S ribosomal protein S2 [Aeropyrum pernix]|uniref:Small ribosomal subunit protein uS2 n=1 Tax=Aeropyrum pernix TaxID=56636 RepID=A0A401H8I4_AERPX|nr:30S ribosomal protein S2 [Aeropyrum pernix]GBF08703.1 30S ribosomal protein S2 [Aeropyrum pernix]